MSSPLPPLLILPPEILGDILSYESVSHKSRELWLCGNRALQSKLAHGVFTVSLVNHYKWATHGLPTFLSQLRSLRSLRINRVHLPFYDKAQVSSVLKSLTPNLESLEIVSPNSASLLFDSSPPPLAAFSLFDDESSDSDPSPGFPNEPTLSSLFPRLKTLKTGGKIGVSTDALLSLPSTLTSLSVPISGRNERDIIQFMRALPPQLARLTLISHEALDSSVYAHLPPTLRGICFDTDQVQPNYTQDDLPKMPPGLEEVETSEAVTLSVSSVRALPPNLLEIFSIEADVFHPERWIEILPSGLQTFVLYMNQPVISPDLLRLLPRTITDMEASFSWDDLKKDDFPPNLKSLKMRLTENLSDEQLSFLPPSLTALFCEDTSNYSPSSINLLPRSLKRLTWVASDFGSEISFPPYLRFLSIASDSICDTEDGETENDRENEEGEQIERIEGEDGLPPQVEGPKHLPTVVRCFPFLNLPVTLTEISFDEAKIPASRIQHLPPSLTLLSAASIFLDSAFDRYDPLLVTRAKRQIVEEQKDNLSAENVQSANLFDMLPRSLQSLMIDEVEALPYDAPEEWRRLPQKIEYLHLPSVLPVDADCVKYIPQSSLLEISITVKVVRNTHVMLLPKRLYLFSLKATENDFLTDDIIPHLPLELNRIGSLSNEMWKRYTHLSRARDAAFVMNSVTSNLFPSYPWQNSQ